jgi:hypothetical protein
MTCLVASGPEELGPGADVMRTAPESPRSPGVRLATNSSRSPINNVGDVNGCRTAHPGEGLCSAETLTVADKMAAIAPAGAPLVAEPSPANELLQGW